MKDHNLWQMSRATRQIISVIDATPILKKICGNKKNTRELQKLFGDTLAQKGIKTSGITEKGSGGNRTWMTLPKIFGVYYQDKNKIIKFTQAGNVIAEGKEPANEMMVKQLLTFQYPNRTQEHRSQQMNKKFCIFPYRFIIKLLLELDYLTVKEIAYFVLPVSSEKELSSIIKNIKLFRKKKMKFDYESHRKKYKNDHDKKKYEKYINDLANTFKNHMEFLPGIISERKGSSDILLFEKDQKQTWNKKIKEYDKDYPLNKKLYHGQDAKLFVDKYGINFGRIKASSKTSKPVTKEQTQNRKIMDAIIQIEQNSLEKMSEKQKIKEISKICSFVSKKEISKKLSEHPEWISKKFNTFEEKYLSVARDGEKHEEFEIMTNQILKKFGFDVKEKVIVKFTDEQQGVIDTLVTYNSESGVIDEKSGKKFSCGNERVGPMENYIREARKIPNTNLKFFGYVYGKEFSTPGGFNRIREEMKINGFRISAANLLLCLDAFKNKKITSKQIWKLFKKNEEITIQDY